MGKSVLKINRSEPSEIKKVLSENEAYTVALRLHMVYMVSLGNSCRKLAEISHISFKQITNWVHRFEDEGIEGLKDRKGRGRHGALTSERFEEIKSVILNENPQKYKFTGKVWTGPIIKQWIKNEYGITFQTTQIYNLLEKLEIVFEKKRGFVAAGK